MDNIIINDLMEWSRLRPDHKADRGASTQEIEDAERRLGFLFPDDYRWFLESYGGGQYGPFALIGLRHSSEMSVHVRDMFVGKIMDRHSLLQVPLGLRGRTPDCAK